jgi:hypothetical protein
VVKTKVGESKTIIEFDSEEAFKQLFFRQNGTEMLMKRLFQFFRGKIKMDFPIELIKGARIIAFIKEDDSSLTKAYGRLLLATRAALAEPIKGKVTSATDTEAGPSIKVAPVDPALD